MTVYYRECLEKGNQYQDFVCDQLWRNYHISIGVYSSKKWQFEKGESASGIEIKFDGKLEQTGNLYIEVAEKSNPEFEEYIPSGIFRDDNTWLYLIGNYKEAYLFPKKWLKAICTDEKKIKTQQMKPVQIATSKGFLLPAQIACRNMICIRKFIFQ